MPQPEELPQNLLDILKVNISVNSSYTSKLLSVSADVVNKVTIMCDQLVYYCVGG